MAAHGLADRLAGRLALLAGHPAHVVRVAELVAHHLAEHQIVIIAIINDADAEHHAVHTAIES
jgi:hypothetical protein